MKEQIFEYQFQDASDGDEFIRNRDLTHAIGNSDQYPVPLGSDTPEGKIQEETIEAVTNAIDAAPKYRMRTRAMVDLLELEKWLSEKYVDELYLPKAVPADIIGKAVSMLEHVNTIERVDGGTACDHCEVGREKRCGHAEGRHYDVWGEGLGKPDYCPYQTPDDLPF